MHGMQWGIYVHIYTQYLSQRAQRISLFPSTPWSRIPVVMQGQMLAAPQQPVGKEEFVFLGQKLENLTGKKTLKNYRKSKFQRHGFLYQYCSWQYMSILEHSSISGRYNHSVLNYNNKQEMLHIRSFATSNMVIYYNTIHNACCIEYLYSIK